MKTAPKEFSINCTGDVVTGDTIEFSEGVFGGSHRNPSFLGDRVIQSLVTKDSYGAAKQQHTFTIEVLASTGVRPLEAGTKTTRKGRNIYRNGTKRMAWSDESLRGIVADAEHKRGDKARINRDARQKNNEENLRY